jgi:hypothetical protein
MISTVRAFEVDDGTPADFLGRVRSALEERGLRDFVEVSADGGELVVRLKWMGSSVLRYQLSATEGGFRADPAGEKISPFHVPFRQRFAERFDQVLGAVGARGLF